MAIYGTLTTAQAFLQRGGKMSKSPAPTPPFLIKTTLDREVRPGRYDAAQTSSTGSYNWPNYYSITVSGEVISDL